MSVRRLHPSRPSRLDHVLAVGFAVKGATDRSKSTNSCCVGVAEIGVQLGWDAECPICLESISTNPASDTRAARADDAELEVLSRPVTVLQCGHVLHSIPCARTYFRDLTGDDATCPVCRQPISANDQTHINYVQTNAGGVANTALKADRLAALTRVRDAAANDAAARAAAEAQAWTLQGQVDQMRQELDQLRSEKDALKSSRVATDLGGAIAALDAGAIETMLKDADPPIDLSKPIDAGDGNETAPVHLALKAASSDGGYRHAAAIRALLDAGSPVDLRDADGFTPLMRASQLGLSPVVAELVFYGANTLAKTKGRRSQNALTLATDEYTERLLAGVTEHAKLLQQGPTSDGFGVADDGTSLTEVAVDSAACVLLVTQPSIARGGEPRRREDVLSDVLLLDQTLSLACAARPAVAPVLKRHLLDIARESTDGRAMLAFWRYGLLYEISRSLLVASSLTDKPTNPGDKNLSASVWKLGHVMGRSTVLSSGRVMSQTLARATSDEDLVERLWATTRDAWSLKAFRSYVEDAVGSIGATDPNDPVWWLFAACVTRLPTSHLDVHVSSIANDVVLESRGDVRDAKARELLKERLVKAMQIDLQEGGLAYGDMLAFSTDSVAESFALVGDGAMPARVKRALSGVADRVGAMATVMQSQFEQWRDLVRHRTTPNGLRFVKGVDIEASIGDVVAKLGLRPDRLAATIAKSVFCMNSTAFSDGGGNGSPVSLWCFADLKLGHSTVARALEPMIKNLADNAPRPIVTNAELNAYIEQSQLADFASLFIPGITTMYMPDNDGVVADASKHVVRLVSVGFPIEFDSSLRAGVVLQTALFDAWTRFLLLGESGVVTGNDIFDRLQKRDDERERILAEKNADLLVYIIERFLKGLHTSAGLVPSMAFQDLLNASYRLNRDDGTITAM